MKKQIVIISLLIILISLLTCNVQAYNTNIEIDPNNYITMPSSIYNNTGTITISSSVESSATLYYQKVDISNSLYEQIRTKREEIQNYENTENAKLTAERANVIDLQNEYREIALDSSKTDVEKEAAREAYENAVNAYNSHFETANAKMQELNNQYKNLIPSYQESNWIVASKGSNNVNLDFTNYSGQVNFALWAKLVTSNDTYYDLSLYSTNIKSETSISLDKTTATLEVPNTLKLNATTNSDKTISWTSSKENVATVDSNGNVKAIAEGTTVITATVDGKSATCTITVTKANNNTESDFSNAEFSYKSNNFKHLEVTINNFKVKEGSSYYVYISKNNNETITNKPDGAMIIVMNSDGSGTATLVSEDASKVLEYAGKNYIYIIERSSDSSIKVILKAKEMPTIPLPNLGRRLDLFLYDANKTMVVNTIRLSDNRKINYKIGKITSSDILKSFKNDSSNVAFANLLEYAKKATYMDTGVITPNDLDYNLVNKLNIEEDAYYFVYMIVDTENGKYVEVEDVAIYKEDNTDEGNAIGHFDYADIEAKEENQKDTTVAPDAKLPQTGISYTIISITVLIIFGGIIAYTKYKKYIDIK